MDAFDAESGAAYDTGYGTNGEVRTVKEGERLGQTARSAGMRDRWRDVLDDDETAIGAA